MRLGSLSKVCEFRCRIPVSVSPWVAQAGWPARQLLSPLQPKLQNLPGIESRELYACNWQLNQRLIPPIYSFSSWHTARVLTYIQIWSCSWGGGILSLLIGTLGTAFEISSSENKFFFFPLSIKIQSHPPLHFCSFKWVSFQFLFQLQSLLKWPWLWLNRNLTDKDIRAAPSYPFDPQNI